MRISKVMMLAIVTVALALGTIGCEEKAGGDQAKKEAPAKAEGAAAEGGEKAAKGSAEAAPDEQPPEGEKVAQAEPVEGEPMDHGAMAKPQPNAETAKLVHQPGAKQGEWTMCPTMKGKFEVKENQASADYNGQKVFFCCAGCEKKFFEDPEGALAALNSEIDTHNEMLKNISPAE